MSHGPGLPVRTTITLAKRLAEVRPHGTGPGSSIHYSTVSMVVSGHHGRRFYLDLRPVADLLGFDYAVIGGTGTRSR